jgi:hypothetical protein
MLDAHRILIRIIVKEYAPSSVAAIGNSDIYRDLSMIGGESRI